MSAATATVCGTARIVLSIGGDTVRCRAVVDEVGLTVEDGMPGAVRLLGFQRDRWSPTLSVVASESWSVDEAGRSLVAAERMLPVFELEDGQIVQIATPVDAIEAT